MLTLMNYLKHGDESEESWRCDECHEDVRGHAASCSQGPERKVSCLWCFRAVYESEACGVNTSRGADHLCRKCWEKLMGECV